ncbi:MAG: hypothetical protein IE887_04005 [Campylobacterales bacterium]|nr:hypothetical protein [Campylobacterales bacterium]
MSKYKVEFTLKQHTPIIHFQSNQFGATLRATELKSKFDRFIKLQLIKVDKNLYEKFASIINNPEIFPEDKGSNAYKIFIENNSTNILSTPKAYVNAKKEADKTAYQAPYFADMHKSIMTSGSIKVIIKSFNQDLLKLLDAIKDYIFIYENFGTRQSKGFGSYLREDISEKEILSIQKKHLNPVFELCSYSDYKAAFISIDTFYKKIKMGINKPYFKSLLFEYMCSKTNLGWEKKFIKNNFPEVIHGEHQPAVCETSSEKEYRYIRAVLGLAEHNEFRPQDGKKQIKIKSTDGIERFKSPITFKIFNNKVYIMFDNSYKEILNKEFSFSLNRKTKMLKTPQENEFNMYKFLKFIEKEKQLIKEII